jgi:Zn-dependent M16 (insulinase) family peptidase
MGEYLSGTIISPLNKELVDIPSPYWCVMTLCFLRDLTRIRSTSISFGSEGRAKFEEFHVWVSDVPIKYLDSLEVKIRKTLRKILKRGIDMKWLHSIIDQSELAVRTFCVVCFTPHERLCI